MCLLSNAIVISLYFKGVFHIIRANRERERITRGIVAHSSLSKKFNLLVYMGGLPGELSEELVT